MDDMPPNQTFSSFWCSLSQSFIFLTPVIFALTSIGSNFLNLKFYEHGIIPDWSNETQFLPGSGHIDTTLLGR